MEEEEGKKTFVAQVMRLIKIEDKDINLKFLFDNVRNYLICEIVFIASAHLFSAKKTFFEIPFFGKIAGSALLLIASVLALLNLFQGMYAFKVYLKIKFSWLYWLALTLSFTFLTYILWELLLIALAKQ
jgi:hypothetical protein